MPVKVCSEGGKNGFQWGDAGKCYTYATGDEKGMKAAKQKAYVQGYAATGGAMKEGAFVKLGDVARMRLLEGRKGNKRELAEDVLKAWNRKLFSKEKDKKKGQKC